MTQRSVAAGLGLMLVLAGCNRYGPSVMFTTPGWYLERPRLMMVAGPEIFAGPMTYDECEAKRATFPATTASDLLCINEKTKPGPYGPFTPSSRLPATPKS
ncbi:MAG TPA: hypothetical protein VKY24_17150 [Reyranella sp.]|jgi:hypothetical protein|nr:hypothetical protein [Reyranella sp.]